MQKCTKCEEEKPLEDYKTTRQKYKACYQCRLKQAAAYKRANPNCHRKSMLMKTYGMTLEEFDNMLVKQQHRCAICRSGSSGDSGSFRVDHNHKTGEIRGLLCNPCNLTLGNAKESINRLSACALYLKEQGHYEEVDDA